MVKDLPNLHSVCWSMKGWSEDKKLLCWTMFLTSMCLFARASEVTDYCPLVENIVVPTEESRWDTDGYPKFIEVALLRWKNRTSANVGKPYRIRIWRNYKKAQYCPLLYILRWLHFSEIKSGPMFQMPGSQGFIGKPLEDHQWTGMTRRLFTEVL